MWACTRWSSATQWGKRKRRLHSIPAFFHPMRLGTVTKLWNTQRSLSSICAWFIPLPYRLNSYLKNIQVTGPVGNSSYQAGRMWPCLWKALSSWKTKFVFWLSKMSTDYANRCCWRILTYSWWPVFPGLPQGSLFTKILCNSLFRLCALSDISAYLIRTVETETTRIGIGCHFIRTVLVVRWHHIRVIALR